MPEPDYENMTDEEFAASPEPVITEEEVVEEPTEVVVEEPIEEEVVVEVEEPADEKVVAKKEEVKEEGEEEDKPKEELEEPKPEEKEEFDYKAAYEQAMAPFKADGKEFTPKSPADLQRLAQMGINYHGKMAGMKPARKALKTLENNGLLDEKELSLVIDAYKGNPEAITSLIKKHKINPLDVDIEAETTYTPTDYTVSDAEVELDTVLDAIQESPNYSKTLEAVTKKWDDTSRSQAASNPQIIAVINEHMDSGVYDKVMTSVQYERSMGGLKGVSDFEAYKQVGNRMDKEGAFDSPEPVKEVTKPKVDPVKEQQRVAKKKAASPTKSTPKKVGAVPKDFNPLDLSDEDFEKFDPKLIGITK